MKMYFSVGAATAALMFQALAVAPPEAAGQQLNGSATMLVVPARPAPVRLGQDLAGMRNVTLVSFRGGADTAQPVLFAWTGRDWQYVEFETFCSLSFVKRAPEVVFVAGDDRTVPRALIRNMDWGCQVERLASLQPADWLNALDKRLKFSSREWRRLSEEYGLDLRDLNEARRRQMDPYENRGAGDAPPAVVIEKSSGQQEKKPAEKPWIK